MKEFCSKHAIPVKKCGKVIVAVDSSELDRLEALRVRAVANGVDIHAINSEEVRHLEPVLSNALGGLWVPESAVTDYSMVTNVLHQLVTQDSSKGRFVGRFEVVAIERNNKGWLVRAKDGRAIAADRIVACAGLYGDRVAKLAGGAAEPTIVPVRGEWRYLRGPKQAEVTRLIYPVPDPKFPWLGVHFTPRLDGSVLVGPNALLATARQGYTLTTANVMDMFDMAKHAGVRKLVQKEFVYGLGELSRSLSRHAHLKELRRYIPDLTVDDLSTEKRAGVRALAMHDDGRLVDDFWFDSTVDGLVHVRNAPSPGATASLLIGEKIVDQLDHSKKMTDPAGQN